MAGKRRRGRGRLPAKSGRCLTASVELLNLTILGIVTEAVLAACACLSRDIGQHGKKQVDIDSTESQQEERKPRGIRPSNAMNWS